jgi:hypothetical protein
MAIEAALDLDPGVVIKMPKNGYFQAQNNGAIHANGTKAEHVVFDSYLDGAQAGDWEYIAVTSSAAGTSKFSYTDFMHGGYAGYGALYVSGRTVALDHCTFSENISSNNACDVNALAADSKITDNGGNDYIECK